jgi:type I restriction-modification system specificity determinant
MDYLQQLLNNQPVEWKKLGEVAENMDYLRKPITSGNRVAGDYPYYGASGIVDYVDNYIFDGDFLLVSEDGANLVARKTPIAFSISGKNWVNNHAHVLKFNTYIERKFVEYYLNNLDISEYVSGAAQPKLNQNNLNRIPIPIPPLSVQSRIVEILDKFTAMEAELEQQLQAELELRKKQYQHYREQLLNFSYTPPSEFNVVYRKLGEVAQYSKGRIDASTLNSNNYVGVDNLLQDCQGKKLSEHVPTEGRCTAYSPKDILIGNIRPYLKKIWFADNTGGTNGDVLVIQATDERVFPEYLYQVLSEDAFFKYDMQHAKGAKMPRGSKDKILDYKIPIPPLSEQQRIVEILDKFDTLTNSISEGLPLEIKLRRQQYEYYREQLLDFRR